MKLGLGLYAGMVNEANLAFARQMSCTHIVQHLPGVETLPSTSQGYWSADDLRRLSRFVADQGLKLEAIENFPPAHWSDILLGGPRREAQMENLKQTIRNMGEAGIPTMGYYFSVAGVWARTPGKAARGGAKSIGFHLDEAPEQTPVPFGEVWGTRVDPEAPAGDIGTVSLDEMWERVAWYLERLVPVAEECGVRLAAHPDDPPLPELRGTARLITHPDCYQRLLELVPSPANALEFCQGTVTEMRDSDPYDAIRRFAGQQRIAYVHFRNVKGTVPDYDEVFLDEGDVDMVRALRIYQECGYDGVLIPDHTPSVSCDAPWHAGMAYALGYMRAAMTMLGVAG